MRDPSEEKADLAQEQQLECLLQHRESPKPFGMKRQMRNVPASSDDPTGPAATLHNLHGILRPPKALDRVPLPCGRASDT